ncbi:MAG: RNA polymerase factor sigma-54, partial [Gallionella sp.]|nr:RNA polymerase factor sigma-54 [Gallionella sp.]
MKASLQLRLSQQLALTPQLQQALRLLQLSTQDMQEEVSRMLDENPMLEMADDTSSMPFTADTMIATPQQKEVSDSRDDREDRDFSSEASDWNTASAPYSSDDEDDSFPEQAALQASLREHLHDELCLSQLDDKDRHVIGMLIEALDENGYLEQDLEELVTLLPAELNISLDDLETALVQLQHLDQPGLGARNLSECLELQLKALPKETPQRELAIRLVRDYLGLVGAHDFAKIKKLLRC